MISYSGDLLRLFTQVLKSLSVIIEVFHFVHIE